MKIIFNYTPDGRLDWIEIVQNEKHPFSTTLKDPGTGKVLKFEGHTEHELQQKLDQYFDSLPA